MAPPVIMHVNYCEQGQTLEEMCIKAVAWGYDGIEFRKTRTKVDETVDQYLDEVEAAVKKSGLPYVLFGGPGPDLMTPDADTRARTIDEACSFYRNAAARFDLSVCNTMTGALRNPVPGLSYSNYAWHGSAAAADAHWEWAAEGFRILGGVASELGFRFAFETHMGYLHDLPAPAKKLVDLIGNPAVGINLDYGNAFHFPSPPSLQDAIAQCGDRLYYVHLKNYANVRGTAGKIATSLAEGEINNREFLRTIKANGYDGPICPEAPRAGDREWYAQQDLLYVKSLLEDLAW